MSLPVADAMVAAGITTYKTITYTKVATDDTGTTSNVTVSEAIRYPTDYSRNYVAAARLANLNASTTFLFEQSKLPGYQPVEFDRIQDGAEYFTVRRCNTVPYGADPFFEIQAENMLSSEPTT